MKKILLALAFLLLPAVASAQQPFPTYGIDYTANNSQATAATGHARTRFNSGTGNLEVSTATAAYDGMTLLTAIQTLTNKTLTAPVLGGTITGTYTLGGTPTLTSPTLNGGTWNGTLSGALQKPQRIANNSGTPTIAVGNATQLGTTPAAAMSGGDVGGTVTLTTGTGPAAFTAALTVNIGVITWNTTFSAAPKGVPLHPCNTAANLLATGTNSLSAFIDQATCTTTQCTVKIGTNGTPTLAASTAYQFCYTIIQ